MAGEFGNFGCIYLSETGVVSGEINQATKYWQNALTFEMYCKHITSKPNGFLSGMQKLLWNLWIGIIYRYIFSNFIQIKSPHSLQIWNWVHLDIFFLLAFLFWYPPTFTNNIMEKENNFCARILYCESDYIYKRPCRLRLATKING